MGSSITLINVYSYIELLYTQRKTRKFTIFSMYTYKYCELV